MDSGPDERANGDVLRDLDVSRALVVALETLSTVDNTYAKLLAIRDSAEVLQDFGEPGHAAIEQLAAAARDIHKVDPAAVQAAINQGIERAQGIRSGRPEPSPSIAKVEPSAEIVRLARLEPIEYEHEREAAAARLGMRVSAVDNFVKAQRAVNSGDCGQGRAFQVATPDPWSDTVDGAELLSDITAAIRRHVALPDGTAETVGMWVLHTYCYDAFMISPRLAITSPEKGCGKTTLLDVLGCLVARPLPTSNATVGAIFRVVETMKPTLLMDEAETFLPENDELRGILNTGHRKGGSVLRCVGDDHEPRTFSTWAPAAIAAIGKLPDTIEDRSISCKMRRRKATERVESFRSDRTEHLRALVRKAMRWAVDNDGALRDADPHVGELQNRVADNWRPLLAIADVAGGEWPKRMREIATAAVAAKPEQSTKVQLLTDIKAAFEAKGTDKLSSESLTDFLIKLDDRPWVEWKGGRPLTKAGLGRLLSPFGISSTPIRFGLDVAKGYHLSAFEDVFARYTPSQKVTTTQTYSHNGFCDFEKVTADSGVTFSKSQKSNGHSDCNAVTFSEPPGRMNGHTKPSDALDWDDRRPAMGPPGDSLDDFE
jgi:putative DNA primase/helicase